jgi:hypothetical protein
VSRVVKPDWEWGVAGSVAFSQFSFDLLAARYGGGPLRLLVVLRPACFLQRLPDARENSNRTVVDGAKT